MGEMLITALHWAFWPFLAGAVIMSALWVLADSPRPGRASLSLIAMALYAYLIGQFDVVTAVRANPMLIGLIAACTLFAGMVAAGIWFYDLNRDRFEAYIDDRLEFLREHDVPLSANDPRLTQVPAHLFAQWKERCARGFRRGYRHYTYEHDKDGYPLAADYRDHLTDITNQILFWPVILGRKVIRIVFSDFFTWMARGIAHAMRGVFNRIARAAGADLRKSELTVTKPPSVVEALKPTPDLPAATGDLDLQSRRSGYGDGRVR